MKFTTLLLLTIVVILKLVFSKKQPSQGSRNYRKMHHDLSYNPLPHTFHTAPRSSFAMHSNDKYKQANLRLVHTHQYKDTTNIVADKARYIH